jgi:predicted membrane channel-forming protein YqfA (hemolysin III family)
VEEDAVETMTLSDDILWWVMISVAIAAAGLSIAMSVLDRRASPTPGRRTRFLMHMVSYVLMTGSVLIFVLRGLLAPG